MLHKRVEVSVAVKQRESALDATSGDYRVDGLANGNPQVSCRSLRLNRPGSAVGSHCIKVALPTQFAAKAANIFLLAQPQHGTQSQLNGFALGLQAGRTQRVLHQLVIDNDIGSNDVNLPKNLYTWQLARLVFATPQRALFVFEHVSALRRRESKRIGVELRVALDIAER